MVSIYKLSVNPQWYMVKDIKHINNSDWYRSGQNSLFCHGGALSIVNKTLVLDW